MARGHGSFVIAIPRESTISTVSRTVSIAPGHVWEVLCDGWLFPLWVVGAARTRDVDESWPRPGARIHHSVGPWPALVNDHTEVVDFVDGEALHLRASAGLLGTADVTITLAATINGDTEVHLDEKAVSGLGSLMPAPVLDPILGKRNEESLRRLAFIAERRSAKA